MPAGPSVMVRVLGDLSGLSKSFKDTTSKGSAAAKGLHEAFSGVLGALNKTGILGPFGEALDGVDQAIESVSGHAKEIGPAMMGIGSAVAGIGLGLTALGSKDQAAHQQLQSAVEATGHSYEQYAKQVDAAIKHQEKFGDTANQTQDALRVLTQATGDPAKALKLLGEATDLAAAKHEDLVTAAGQLGKAANGNTRIFKEFGIQLGKGATAQEKANALTLLGAKIHGQASAAANTFSGHVAAIKAHLDDVASELGRKYGPALTAAGTVTAGLGGAFTAAKGIMDTFSKSQKAVEATTEAVATAQDTEAAASWLSLGPLLLIIAAVAALVAIGYVIYRNWTTIWTAIKKSVEDVWVFIKANWPLLLGILLGPIALAAALIYKYWDQIKKGAKAVVDYIAAVWNNLVAFFAGIPARLYAVASGMWNFVWSEADTVRGWVVGVWNALINYVAGIPRAILGGMSGLWKFVSTEASTASSAVQGVWNSLIRWVGGLPAAIARTVPNMWHGITDAFRAAVNGLIDIWDRLHFKIGGWHVGPVHLPTVDVGMPHIPHLAQGGLMTGSGLVFAHAGEVITPAPMAARKGPVVHIDKAVFSTQMDVESFMRQVAWTATTRGM